MLISGGADGSDMCWAVAALKRGDSIEVWSFDGHKMPARHPTPTCVHHISKEQTFAEKDALILTGTRLRKQVPKAGTYVGNLIRRNYYIASSANSMYAIGKLTRPDMGSICVNVDGGTGWSCQLFADKCLAADSTDRPLPLFVYSNVQWYQCVIEKNIFHWRVCANIPTPQGMYAGVGTRDISSDGVQAISRVINLYN